MVSLEGRRPTAPSIGFQRATSGQRAVAKIAKLANKHALKCAAEIGEFLAPPRAPARRRAMHRNFPCFSILGLTSIRALVSVIRDMAAMPAASPRTESDRADRHRRAAHYRAGNAALRPISRRLPHGHPVKPVNAVKNSSGRV
jgi:hypothetical protein